MTSPRAVRVQVTRVTVSNLWRSPESPRAVDRPVVVDDPDVSRWLGQLDAHAGESKSGDGRLGLHGRLLTQLVQGEPVLVVGDDPAHPGWVQVRAPWQPTSLDPRGYPGWVRASHLDSGPEHRAEGAMSPRSTREPRTGRGSGGSVPGSTDDSTHPLVATAREYLELPYLWGGASPSGLDCSGLVHWCYRALGVVVPRDADDQQRAARTITVEQARPGDLYFFRSPGSSGANHVGIMTGRGTMIHAPETGLGLVEEPVDPQRQATFDGVGRLAG